MNTQKRSAGIIVSAIVGLVAVVGVAVWWGAANTQLFSKFQPGSAQTALLSSAPSEPAESIRTPSFGIARGQTARINVFNCREDQGFIIDWKFLDADGSVLKQNGEPIRIDPSDPSRIISFDLNGDELSARRDVFGRIQMRAVIYGLGGPDTFERNAGVSVEIIDNSTGRSALFVGPQAVKGCSNNL